MRRLELALGALVALALCPALAAQTPTGSPAAPATNPRPRVNAGAAPEKEATAPAGVRSEDTALERQYSARLSLLRPGSAEEYFRLAEEVADGAVRDVSRRRLATRLYVLAYEIGRGAPDGRAIAASACLGLADVAGGKRDRVFLESLARALDPRHAAPGWVDAPEIATSDSAGYRLAVLLGEVRAGEGIRARRILEDSDVGELLDRYDVMMGKSGFDNGAWTVRREAERWPCPECHNDRVVRKMVQGEVEYRVCPVCGGLPGPRLTGEQLLGQLRFESWLLQGKQRSWASQLGMDGGAPLVDPDPARLGALFGVDTTLLMWKNGLWMPDPSAPRAEEKKSEDKEKGTEKAPEAVPAPSGS